MGNPLTADWYRLTYQVLLYLEEVYACLSEDPAVSIPKTIGCVDWGVDGGEAYISFEVNPAGVKHLKNNWLWIGLWLTEEGARGNRPVWIQDLRGDDRTWQRLKGEFSEASVWDKEGNRLVGPEWELPANATNEDLKAAGLKLADRIKKVLIS